MELQGNITAYAGRASANPLVRRQLWARSNLLILIEWSIIMIVAFFFAGSAVLNFDSTRSQQSGEHNQAATLPLRTINSSS